jgi:hypothetical protein
MIFANGCGRPVRHQELARQAGGAGHPLAVLPGLTAVRRILLREGGRGAFLPTAKAGGIRRRKSAMKLGL